MSTKITRGARLHLLALYTPGVPCTLTLRHRMHWPMVRARQSLKKLERELRKCAAAFVVLDTPGGTTEAFNAILDDANHSMAMSLLGKVYP